MSPTARTSATIAPAPDLDACVAAWFPPDSFDPDSDLSFLCTEHEGRTAASKVRKALLAGGRGKRITDAMKEWQRFGWFEIPVVATLRAACCPGAPPLELPHVPGSSCPAPRKAVQALGVATATHGDVAGTLKAYRKVVSCFVDMGDVPAYGQTGGIGIAEEPAFRAFAERGTVTKR